jgi:hypothetical protein
VSRRRCRAPAAITTNKLCLSAKDAYTCDTKTGSLLGWCVLRALIEFNARSYRKCLRQAHALLSQVLLRTFTVHVDLALIILRPNTIHDSHVLSPNINLGAIWHVVIVCSSRGSSVSAYLPRPVSFMDAHTSRQIVLVLVLRELSRGFSK